MSTSPSLPRWPLSTTSPPGPPSRGVAHVTLAELVRPSPFAAYTTSKAETSKHSKYDRPVASMNPPLKFVAIAFNS